MAPKGKTDPKAKAEPAKRKAEEEPQKAPAAKEQKVEPAKAGDKPAEVAEKVEKVEQEKDAPADARPGLKEKIGFNAADTTLNVVPTMDGRVLSSLNDGGLQYFIAGARGNVGMKSGRYMFEVKLMEVLNPAEQSGGRSRPPLPRQLLRLGVSTEGSSLVLGESEDHVCFDSEGKFTAGKKTIAASKRIMRDQVVACVVNLDASSPHANTLSLFVDGVRVSEPQPIPEGLHGKTLYPHVSFRNVTVQLLLNSEPAKALPFKCRTLQGAAKADVVVSQKKESQYNVVFPVGRPDEGTFDWLDGFLAKNPGYVELSDRKLIEWAKASGIWRAKNNSSYKPSNDRPDFNFGLPSLDDRSTQRIINNIAPLIPRNYVVMEIKSNLTAADRAVNLRRFGAPHYKKIAHVAMGEPPVEFKKAQQDLLLKEKQQKLDAKWKHGKLEFERKKLIRENKEKQAAEKKKRVEEAKAKIEEAKAKKAEKEGEKKEDKKEEEKKEEEKTDEDPALAKANEEKKEEPEVYPEAPEKAELSEEELQRSFRTRPQYDLSQSALNKNFANFSLPEASEGFSKVVFDWQPAAKATEYLQAWVSELKKKTKIEDLEPGQWFTEKQTQWSKTLEQYQGKQTVSKAALKGKPATESKADITAVENVCDVGGGTPLFIGWAFEDWALTMLRYEFFLLLQGFAKDVDDAERVGIPEGLVNFYYNKYYRKQLNPKFFGVSSVSALLDLIQDTAVVNEEKVLTTPLAEDTAFDQFVKVTEEQRRQRQRRVDAGDETARVKFERTAMQKGTPAAAAGAAAGVAGKVKKQWVSHRSTPAKGAAKGGVKGKGKGATKGATKGGGKGKRRW